MGIRSDKTPTTPNARWWAFLLSGKRDRLVRARISGTRVLARVSGRATVLMVKNREAGRWTAVRVALTSPPMPVSVIGAEYRYHDPGLTVKASASRSLLDTSAVAIPRARPCCGVAGVWTRIAMTA